MRFPAVVLTIFLVATKAWSAPVAGDATRRFLEDRIRRDPDDFIAWNQFSELALKELRATGDDRWIVRAVEAAEKSLAALPAAQNPGGLAVLAQAQITAHRFAEAHASATKLRELQPGKVRPLELLADAAIELGRYAEAKTLADEIGAIAGAEFSAASRQAKLAMIEGRLEDARTLYQKGLEHAAKATPRDADTVAHFQLQLGALAFKQGDWETAEAHYRAAAETAPAGFAAEDYLAELRGAQGRFEEAIALYEKLAQRVPRPEFFQALGDLHALAGQKEKATEWHTRAEEAYLESVNSGAVHFYHHLAGFYADSKEDAAKAVEWARKDLAMRQSIYAHDALAWALYKKGEATEAAAEIAKALATGSRDPHLLYHAGMIRMSTGDIAGGKDAMQQAAAVNPKFNTFHVHR